MPRPEAKAEGRLIDRKVGENAGRVRAQTGSQEGVKAALGTPRNRIVEPTARSPIGTAERAHKARKVAGRLGLIAATAAGEGRESRTRKGERPPTLGDREVIEPATLGRQSSNMFRRRKRTGSRARSRAEPPARLPARVPPGSGNYPERVAVTAGAHSGFSASNRSKARLLSPMGAIRSVQPVLSLQFAPATGAVVGDYLPEHLC